MKKTLTSTAILALMAGVAPAMAECNIGATTAYSQEDDAVVATARRDLRQLRNSAMILNTYGKEEACQNVVAAIEDIRNNRGQKNMTENVQQDQQDQTQQQAQTEQQTAERTTKDSQASYEQVMQQAKPIGEIGSKLTVADMMGADLRGSNGQVVGEISNIVLDNDGAPSHAVVSFGGFLGLGEDRVAIPYDKLRIHTNVEDADANDPVFFVAITEEQLASAPRVKQNDNSWISNDDWVSQNKDYYENNVAS
jgi:sporulation protein YlmC with PRC-barrel domain